jgi:hypothetical protein
MPITQRMGYQTEDGKMFPTLNEACGHTYGTRLKEALRPDGSSGVFGVARILEHSRVVAQVLNEYNAELDRLENET